MAGNAGVVLDVLGTLIGLGYPIAIALGLAAVAGIGLQHGLTLLPTIGDIVWNTGNSFTLVAIPMFILMGEIILQTGVWRRSIGASRPCLAGCPAPCACRYCWLCTVLGNLRLIRGHCSDDGPGRVPDCSVETMTRH